MLFIFNELTFVFKCVNKEFAHTGIDNLIFIKLKFHSEPLHELAIPKHTKDGL